MAKILLFIEVTGKQVAKVLAAKMGIPQDIISGHLDGGFQHLLLDLNAKLVRRVIGQDAALLRVSRRLLLTYSGLARRKGPLAVFLFLGPSGVGKTELAKALAAELFGSDNNMIRLDMSEYMEEHSIAKLVGSPPGYVGYDEEGQLTETPFVVSLSNHERNTFCKMLRRSSLSD